ncbi:hypothetical protein OAA09_00210 [bacterium]|nr:hypothetical protein [bacterium]
MSNKNSKLIMLVEASSDASQLLTEGLIYHLRHQIPVDENIFRPGSKSFFKLFREVRSLYQKGLYVLAESEEFFIKDSDIGTFGMYMGNIVPLDFPMFIEDINEAEYKGRKVKLGKAGAQRSEGGKAYVYVNSGKKNKDGTIRVKRVKFGSSMPDAMGKSKKAIKRRKSFGDRHNCSDKDDKTKAGYWSCRLTKLFGRNIPGWW